MAPLDLIGVDAYFTPLGTGYQGSFSTQSAHLIVRQLNLLLTHPELEPVSNTRDMYLQLLEHWQKIAAQLLEQRDTRKAAIVYH